MNTENGNNRREVGDEPDFDNDNLNFDVDFENEEEDFVDQWKEDQGFLTGLGADEDGEEPGQNKDQDLNFGEEEEEEEEGDDLFNEDDESDDAVSLDVAAFNKKLNKNFKNEEELIAYMKSKDEEEVVVDDAKVVQDSELAIEYYTPLIEMNDRDLMIKQFETIATQKGKDINDEEVQYEIEQEVEELIGNYDLNNKASQLRDRLRGLVSDAKAKKTEIENKIESAKLSEETARKESLQKEFIDINANKVFFGVDVDKKRLSSAYKAVSTGQFLDRIKSDPKLLVELATMSEFKEEIFKKTSGKTYSDGLKDVLKDYKSKREDKSITRAQQRGSNGSSDNSRDLIKGFIS